VTEVDKVNILSTPSPNSFTNLYDRIYNAIFGFLEKCISRMLYGLTKPGRMPGLSTVIWSSNSFTCMSVPKMLPLRVTSS
jgi:hypothetical protein